MLQTIRNAWKVPELKKKLLFTVLVLLIFRVGGLLDAGFEQIFLTYSPSVYKVADIIDTFVYRVGLVDHDYSYSVAVSFFKSVVAAVLLLTTNVISKRISGEGIW